MDMYDCTIHCNLFDRDEGPCPTCEASWVQYISYDEDDWKEVFEEWDSKTKLLD